MTILLTIFCNFLTFIFDVNKQLKLRSKKNFEKKNSGSETGSFGQWYRSADPDPCQHVPVTDPDQDSAKSLNPDQQQWIEGHIHGAFSDDINHINRKNFFEIRAF